MEGDVIAIRCFGFSRPGLILSSLHCDQCALFFKRCGHYGERYRLKTRERGEHQAISRD